MRRKSAITTTAAMVLVLAGVAIPGAEAAGPLLSGYGGPGQGNQAILGSTLLNGPSGSGGGGAGAAATATSATSPSAANRGAGGGSASSSSAGRGGSRSHQKRSGHTSSARSPAYSSSSGLPAPQAAVPAAPALGLSNADLVYIILALGALAVTAALTVRLAHRAR